MPRSKWIESIEHRMSTIYISFDTVCREFMKTIDIYCLELLLSIDESYNWLHSTCQTELWNRIYWAIHSSTVLQIVSLTQQANFRQKLNNQQNFEEQNPYLVCTHHNQLTILTLSLFANEFHAFIPWNMNPNLDWISLAYFSQMFKAHSLIRYRLIYFRWNQWKTILAAC